MSSQLRLQFKRGLSNARDQPIQQKVPERLRKADKPGWAVKFCSRRSGRKAKCSTASQQLLWGASHWNLSTQKKIVIKTTFCRGLSEVASSITIEILDGLNKKCKDFPTVSQTATIQKTILNLPNDAHQRPANASRYLLPLLSQTYTPCIRHI